jgi:ankyrin repeat protein
MRGHTEVVKLLLGQFLDGSSLTTDDLRAGRDAALRYACLNGHTEVVKILLGHGLTADDVKTDFIMVLERICERGFIDIIVELLAALTDYDATAIADAPLTESQRQEVRDALDSRRPGRLTKKAR